MTRPWGIFFAAVSFGCCTVAIADSVAVVPPKAIPTVRCIHRVLKASSAIQSISLYAVDDARFAIEYAFRNKKGQVVVSDIEFFGHDGMVTDNIPIEVGQETMDEAQDLESKLDLTAKCHLHYSFDNLIPGPSARAEWQKMDWPIKARK